MGTLTLECLALVGYSAYGRRLGLAGFWQQCLVGVAVCGLLIGCAANLYAALAPTLALALMCGALLLSCLDLVQLARARPWPTVSHRTWALRLVPCLLVIGFLFVNWPVQRVMVIDGDDCVVFNQHMSYFSGLSTEMLNADYPTRLRISNNFDHIWSKYHFFNAACLAAVMAPLSLPNLFAWKVAVLLLASVALLMVLHRVVQCLQDQPAWLVLLKITALTALLLSLFFPWARWSCVTTAYFTMVGVLGMLLALHQGDDREAAIFFLLFCSSTSRTLVAGGMSVVLLFCCCAMLRRWPVDPRRIWTELRTGRHNLALSAFVLLNVAYNGATVLLGEVPTDARTLILHLGGWTEYNIPGMIASTFGHFIDGGLIDNPGDMRAALGDSGLLPYLIGVLVLLSVFAGLMFSAAVRWWRWFDSAEVRHNYAAALSAASIACTCALPVFYCLFVPARGTLRDLFDMSHVWLLLVYLLMVLPVQATRRQWRVASCCCLLAVLLLLSYSALPVAIKGTLSYSVSNAFLFGWITVQFASHGRRWVEVLACVGALAIPCGLVPVQLGAFTFAPLLDRTSVFFTESELDGLPPITRGQVLSVEDIHPDAQVADYWCAVHAARLRGHSSFLTNRFVEGADYALDDARTPEWQRLQDHVRQTVSEGGLVIWKPADRRLGK